MRVKLPRKTSMADVGATLAHHDATLSSMRDWVTAIDKKVDAVATQVNEGFSAISSKLDRVDNRPQFDFHKAIQIVQSVAVLFAMTVTGIIWVTTSQFSGVIEQQKGYNEVVKIKLERQDRLIEKLVEQKGPKDVPGK